MLLQEQEQFYQRWIGKADKINGENIAELIDKYITIFITYNALYNIVPAKMAASTNTYRKDVGDKIGATKSLLAFLGAASLAKFITTQSLDPAISDLAAVIDENLFNIKIDKGKPQPAIDAALSAAMKGNDDAVKMLALLETLYYIRCNIVHGEKNLDQYQELLIIPASKLIRAVVEMTHAQLYAFPY